MRTSSTLALVLALASCADPSKSDSEVDDPTDTQVDDPTDSEDPTDTEVDSCPVLSVSPEALTFSAGEPNTPVSEVVTVTNDCDGTAMLAVALSVDGPQFSIDVNGVELEPGASTEVTVTFEASDFATYTDTLVVVGAAGSAEVSLVGTAGTDADGDGYAAEDSDCNDDDADIHPGADEVWYDGIDQDCDEGSDYDQDGDGYDRDEDGGADCDDTDADISPDGTETQDLVDEDCDGLTDEDFLAEGDVFVTEVLSSPVEADFLLGQWVEVYNASDNELELMGWTFSNEDDSWDIDTSLRIAAGGYAVLGASSDTADNGGVTVDVVWSDIELDDDDDTLTLQAGALTISTMTFDDSWDRVDGASLSLDDTFVAYDYADDKAYWCDATSELADGDLGTPGTVNDNCTSVDHDGDGYSEDDGDCDETDDAVYPEAPEVWDLVDNDCDGLADRGLEITDIAAGSVIGEEWTQGSDDGTDEIALGDLLLLGDIDDDGDDDLLLGAPSADCRTGKVYILEAGDYTSWSDASVSSEAHTILYGWSNRNAWGVMPQELRDLDGDGVFDVTVGGYGEDLSDYTDSLSCSVFDLGPAQWATYSGGSSLSGDLFFTDGDTACSDSCRANTQAMATLDLDGDGSSELYVGSTDTITAYDISSLSGDLSDDDDYAFTLEADTTYGATLGTSLWGADLDGDGYEDLLAGANGDDEAASNAGALYLVYGDSTLPADQTIEDAYTTKLTGDAADDRLDPVARVGDVDGDGDDDLVLADSSAGGVFVFSDTTSLTAGLMSLSDADLTVTGVDHDDFGEWLELADLDGDGQDDLVVAATGDASIPGELFWFPGADLTSSSHDSDDAAMSVVFGNSKTFPGSLELADVSGDGVPDILVGDPEYDATGYGGVLWVLETP